MKNPNQDDAVERMLNQLEYLLKRQHDDARASRAAEPPPDDDAYDPRHTDQAHQPGPGRAALAVSSPPRTEDLHGGNGDHDVTAAEPFEYDPDATTPEADAYDPDTTAIEMDAYDADTASPETDAYDPDVTPREMDAYDPDITPREMDAYDPGSTSPAHPANEADDSGAGELDPYDGALRLADAGKETGAPDEDDAIPPRAPLVPQYALAPDPEAEEPSPVEPVSAVPSQQADNHMTRRLTTRLGQLLVDAGLLSGPQLESALERQQETGERLGAALVLEGLIDEPTLLSVLESQYGVPAAALDDPDLDPSLAKLIPYDMARRYLLVPLALRADAVDVAMVDPTDFVAMAHVRFATGLRPNVFITTVTAAQRAIERLYADEETGTIEYSLDAREEIKRMILDRDGMLIAADQNPRKFYELAASIDAFVDEIFRKVSRSG